MLNLPVVRIQIDEELSMKHLCLIVKRKWSLWSDYPCLLHLFHRKNTVMRLISERDVIPIGRHVKDALLSSSKFSGACITNRVAYVLQYHVLAPTNVDQRGHR